MPSFSHESWTTREAFALRGSGCAAQLADEPDQMSLGCGAQARFPADRSGYVRGRGVLPGEQVVGADAEPMDELDEQIEGWGCLVALDAGRDIEEILY
jgi:hypothetical protein